MRNALDGISLAKLFLITIVAKVVLSFLSWLLGSPWFLGFSAPLALMAGYILIGLARRNGEVSDEKFGDSCYYLGFVFTISSIAFALFDVPELDKAGRLKEVAVRFGAAMVSTFAGIIVRIYLVGFKKDVEQAFDQLEDRLVMAMNDLRGRMELSAESFREFERTVHEHTKDTVLRSTMAFETLGKSLSAEFTASLGQAASGAQTVFATASTEIQTAAAKMTESLEKCISALEGDLRRREAESERFVATLTARLTAMTLPEDFFSKRLAGPISGAAASVDEVGRSLSEFRNALDEAGRHAGEALQEMRASLKSSQAQLSAAKKHTDVITGLTEQLANAAQTMTATATAIKEQREMMAKVIDVAVAGRQDNDEAAKSLRSSAEQLVTAVSALSTAAATVQARMVTLRSPGTEEPVSSAVITRSGSPSHGVGRTQGSLLNWMRRRS